jgi:serine acetyltransferase
MADIGAGAMVAAGSVVSNAVPVAVMVAGNPARFVRRVADVAVPPPPRRDVSLGAV